MTAVLEREPWTCRFCGAALTQATVSFFVGGIDTCASWVNYACYERGREAAKAVLQARAAGQEALL